MVNVKLIKTDLGKNLEKAIKDLSVTVAKVGWPEEARYRDVSSGVCPKRPIQVAQVAYWNEKGNSSRNVPARPFLRPTIIDKSKEWSEIAFKKSKEVIEGKISVSKLFETIGLKAEDDISKKIQSIWSPALSRGTIQARINKYSNSIELKESTRKRRKKEVQRFVSTGLYKPLEDTGYMLSSITHVVETE